MSDLHQVRVIAMLLNNDLSERHAVAQQLTLHARNFAEQYIWLTVANKRLYYRF